MMHNAFVIDQEQEYDGERLIWCMAKRERTYSSFIQSAGLYGDNWDWALGGIRMNAIDPEPEGKPFPKIKYDPSFYNPLNA